MSIKEMVANGRKVRFTHYRSSELWYITENGFAFPVPITDTGDGTFLVEDKAILFMRYIRKHLQMLEAARTELQPTLDKAGYLDGPEGS
jgi:beta-glucosidase/6-phospho-beta-glucosidase/beta-galactosidase